MWVEPEEESKTNVNGQPSPFQAPSVGAGAGGAGVAPTPSGTTSNPSTQAPIQSNQPQQQFATVQDYLKTNQQQGEQLGQKFTNNLSDAATNEKNTISGAAGKAINDISANTIGYDQGLVNTAKNDPTKVAGNQDQLGSFLNQWNAAYKGPASFETSAGYTDAAKAANEAGEKKALTESTGGRQQLLEDDFGVKGQGNKGLDQAILQNSSYFPAVQDQSKQFGGIQDYLKSNSDSVNSLATAAKNTTDQTKQLTQDAFANNVKDFQAGINSKVDQARSQASTTAKQYQDDLASADPAKIAADLKASGMDDAKAKSIVDYITALNKNYGMKPPIDTASFIANPNTDINASNVASADDYKRADAFKTLTGTDYSGVLNPADAAKAGTGNINNTAFKSGDLASYLKQGLDIQDKSKLGTTPTLNWQDVNDGKVTSEQAVKSVQDVIDAGVRQGIDPMKNTSLQSIHSNAMQALQAIVAGHGDLTTPAAKTYADAAVAAAVGKGKTTQEAQAEINDWLQKLGGSNTPQIYK